MRRRTVVIATVLFVALVLLTSSPCEAAKSKREKKPKINKDYQCGVCLGYVDQIFTEIGRANIEHPYKVQSRYRMDEKKLVPYSQSESFVMRLVDTRKVNSYWSNFGILRSAAPVRVVERQHNTDPRALFDRSEDLKAFRAIHEEMIELVEDELVKLLRKPAVRDDVKAQLCNKLYPVCPTLPFEWPEPTDPMPAPPAPAPAPEPAAEPAAAAAAAAGDNSAPSESGSAAAATEGAAATDGSAAAADASAAPSKEEL